ncbi:hypothetical protein P691DRAFT_724964 [Macrolepiota fuliginosa MF-IS2]|uniref:Uncharacterized protein n=1 Tax=Macrolepiota fuliginosa MF-IS2 TaxID=1400762 RepID=A0A9P6C487_9AGAR|nr:hypothetical protein P691DRAFT_724964 [Macrolepiota fuliginosa MF-IS2]
MTTKTDVVMDQLPPPYTVLADPLPTINVDPRPPPTLDTLPPCVLLNIVYSTFPRIQSIGHGKIEQQYESLLWLVSSLRLVNRSFYLACMHVLRLVYLPAYRSLIRQPYTSDPFPAVAADACFNTPTPTSGPALIHTLQRETSVLDHFIALKVHEDAFADESELYLEREDMFKDLFDHTQPKARLEDLVMKYGLREGVISAPGVVAATGQSNGGDTAERSTPSVTTTPPLSPLPGPVRRPSPKPRSASSRFLGIFSRSTKQKLGSTVPTPYPSSAPRTPPPTQAKIKPIPFSSISVSLSPRTIGFVVGSGANKCTLVQVQRGGKTERLETGAKLLINELKGFLLAEA